MKKDKDIQSLVAAFGHGVRVNSEYHVQIAAGGNNKWHDIFFTKSSDIKLKLSGKRTAKEPACIKDAIGIITNYHKNSTDLAAMQHALRLGESIQQAHNVLTDHKLKSAIFVDGGWKEGEAKIAAILVRKNGDADVKVRNIKCSTSSEAEVYAVLLGYELRMNRDNQGIQQEDVDIPIYTDCQPVFTHPGLEHVKNKHWIPRSRNKSADHLGNMRASRKKHDN